MMKKLLFTTMLMAFAMLSFGQTTYYWVGGNGPTSFTVNSNWNTALDGSGVSRGAAAPTDILIFDGSNITGTIVPVTGSVSATSGSASFAQLIIRNNALVTIERITEGGTSTLTVNGGVNDDLQIEAGSSLTIAASGLTPGNCILAMTANATGKVYGNLTLTGGGASLTSVNTIAGGSVFFESGSVCSVNTVNTSRYPFGATANRAIIFKDGSILRYLGGNSFFSNTATNYPIVLQPGSTCDFASSIPSANSTPAHFFNNRDYANVVISGNASVESGNFYNIDNLTIENQSSFFLATAGSSPISGNIINNGTFGAMTPIGTSQLVMVGTSPQTVSGTGTFNDLGAFSVATDSEVTLLESLNISGTAISYITGGLNFGNHSLNGTGISENRGRIQFKPAYEAITNAATIVEGQNLINFSDVADYDVLEVSPGHLITAPGIIPPNTYVIAISSSGTITMSKAAIGSGSQLTVTGRAATAITSNTAGIDGSVMINANGSVTYGSGTNFVFNATTTAPFTTNTSNNLGDVTFNAPATTNRNVTIAGQLTLDNAKLTIRSTDNINIASSGSFVGAFDQNSYIATTADMATGEAGILTLNGLAVTTLIPVGTSTNYTPVTLTPTTASDFSINVFEGATVNATPNGTALTADQKNRLVNAVWNINRTSGTGNCNVTLGWPTVLEGSDFTAFTDAQVGVASYSGSAYSAFVGSGDNTANTASLTVSDFSPMIVGELNTTLPVRLLSFTAQENLNSVKISWKTTSEKDLAKYIVQHAYDGSVGFKNIYTVAAHNLNGTFDYSYVDVNPVAGANYYRLVSEDIDGTQYISEPKSVNIKGGDLITTYPNPIVDNSFNVSGLLDGDIIKITNLKGQVVVTKTANGNSSDSINVQHINPGVYILSVENSGKITTTKRVIRL